MDGKTAVQQLALAIRARVPVVAVESFEEDRVLRAVKAMAAEPVVSMNGKTLVESRRLFRWTLTKGVVRLNPPKDDDTYEPEFGIEATLDPSDAILEFAEWASAKDVDPAKVDSMTQVLRERGSILVMADIHRHMAPGNEDTVLVMRALRDAVSALRPTASALLLLAPTLPELGDIARDTVSLRWPLPTVDELAALIELAASKVAAPTDLNGSTEALARALAGLTVNEARQVLGMAIVASGELSDKTAPEITRLKTDILQRCQGITLIPPRKSLDDIGGLDILKANMARLPKLLTKAARARNVTPPRGILLAGPPGTGKTLCGEVIGGATMPVLLWKVGTSKSKWVGETEANVQKVLDVADAISTCVLLIDEGEKELAAGGGDSTGSNIMAGVMSLILTWMQSKTSDVIVVLTANHPEKLAAELVSRFDKRYFVGYPSAAACSQIAAIHLGHVGIELDADELTLVGDVAHDRGMMGRAIEDAVAEANRDAFVQDTELTPDFLLAAIDRAMAPSDVEMAEITKMEAFCKGSYVNASSNGGRKAARPTSHSVELDFGID